MRIKLYSYDDIPLRSILDLFEIIDSDAVGNSYTTSTAELSKELNDLPPDMEDRVALKEFIQNYMGEMIVLYDQDIPIGFVIFRQNDNNFSQLMPEYTPNIAIHFSGVHPQHQQEGIWTDMRDYLRNEIASKRDVEFLLTGVSVENKIVQNANIRRGFEEYNKTSVTQAESVQLYYKQLTE